MPTGLSKVISKALFGNKNLLPSELAAISRVVTPQGYSKLKSNRGFLKTLAIGNEHAMDIAKARYMQGGLLGKGGLILGDIAPNEDFINSYTKIKNYLKASPGTPHDLSLRDAKNIATGAPGLALGSVFTLGFPLMEANSALRGESEYGDKKGAGVGSALGSGLAFALTGGFGLPAGLLASKALSSAGARVGSLFDREYSEPRDLTIPEAALRVTPGVYKNQ